VFVLTSTRDLIVESSSPLDAFLAVGQMCVDDDNADVCRGGSRKRPRDGLLPGRAPTYPHGPPKSASEIYKLTGLGPLLFER